VQEMQTVSTHPLLTLTVEVKVKGVDPPMLVLAGMYEYAAAHPWSSKLHEVTGQVLVKEFW
jgi:hypothetical protein